MPLPLPVLRPRHRPPEPRPHATSRGQSMVEFALVLPIFALFMVIAVDFGRVFFSYIEINNAAREGAAFGAVSPTDTVGIRSHALQETNVQAQAGENALQVTSACADSAGATLACDQASGGSGAGNTITVGVAEPFTFMTPLVSNFFQNSFQLHATATATVLGYAASGGGPPPGPCSPPVAIFNVITNNTLSVFADPTGSTPNSGVCSISGYNWTWGDGNVEVGSATGNPHTYANPGTYTVILEVTNQGGSTTTTRGVTVPAAPPPPTCAKPVADFSWTSNGKSRTYSDRSTVADPVNCPITDWLWTFTDIDPPAGGLQSNAQNPATVTYGNNSQHPVTLRVTNAGGSTTVTRNS